MNDGSRNEFCQLLAAVEAELQAKDEYIIQLEKRLKNYEKNSVQDILENDDKIWNPVKLKQTSSYTEAENAVFKAHQHCRDVIESQNILKKSVGGMVDGVLLEKVANCLENAEFRKLELKLIGVEKELEESKNCIKELKKQMKNAGAEAKIAKQGFQMVYVDCVSMSQQLDAYEQYLQKQNEALHELPRHSFPTTKNLPKKQVRSYSPQIKPLKAPSLSPSSLSDNSKPSPSANLTHNISSLASELAENLKVDPTKEASSKIAKKNLDFKSFTKNLKFGEKVKNMMRSKKTPENMSDDRSITPSMRENHKENNNTTQLTSQIQSTLESLTSIELLLRSTTDAEAHNV